jgi:hypothetical protein
VNEVGDFVDDKGVPMGTGAELAATISKQVKSIQDGAKNLVTGAGSGFHLEPEAAATLIKACQDSLVQLDGLATHLITLRQAPQLGQTPVAPAVSRLTEQVVTDDQGIVPAIDNLKQTLNDMIAAYRKASTNYAVTEDILAQSFRGTA